MSVPKHNHYTSSHYNTIPHTRSSMLDGEKFMGHTSSAMMNPYATRTSAMMSSPYSTRTASMMANPYSTRTASMMSSPTFSTSPRTRNEFSTHTSSMMSSPTFSTSPRTRNDFSVMKNYSNHTATPMPLYGSPRTSSMMPGSFSESMARTNTRLDRFF